MALNEIVAALTVTAALALGISALRPDTTRAVPVGSAVTITTTLLPLNRDDLAADRIGALRFMGAVQLRAANPRFGGVSGLRFGGTTAGGARMLAITDTGNWLTFETVETAGRLTGVRRARLAPIRKPDGSLPATKAESDAEALEWNPATGEATIVYEQDHRLVHFTGIDSRRPVSLAAIPTRTERLTQMTGWPPNGGGEAMAIMLDGSRIVISERRIRPDGSHAALITRGDVTRDGVTGNGVTSEIGVMGLPDYSPTDAVALDSTRLLVLHRRFDMMGQGAAVSLVDLAPALAPNPPSILTSRILAQWQAPVTLDNMEGLAVRREGDRVFLYIVSDDNLNGLQRTILMKFALAL